jgi:prevent-host-death family protein
MRAHERTIAKRIGVPASGARDNLSDLVNLAAYGKERVILTRRGRPLAAIVSVEDVERLDALEDARDSAIIRERVAAWEKSGRKGVTLEAIAKENGFKMRTRRRAVAR